MKVFISADIEGITTTTIWPQCTKGEHGYEAACAQMTREVAAACEGAIAAGADRIVVKDSHSSATNIDPNGLPEGVELIRGWSGHPYSMVTGVDSSFDAAMFVGYHSCANREGNPLSHTMSTDPFWVKINGVKTSEFMLYSWACALEGVPTVFLSGDQMLCDDSQGLHPALMTVPVKSGMGALTHSLHPATACKKIKETAELALKQDLSKALCTMPDHFVMEICYRQQTLANKRSYFPGFEKIDDNTIRMETDSYFEVLRAATFLL